MTEAKTPRDELKAEHTWMRLTSQENKPRNQMLRTLSMQ